MVNISRIANIVRSYSMKRAVRSFGRAIGIAALSLASQSCVPSKATTPAPASVPVVEVPAVTKIGHFSKTQFEYLKEMAFKNGLEVDKIKAGVQADEDGWITKLSLRYTQVKDISAIVQITTLTSLDLSKTQVRDLSPLTKLAKLKNLGLNSIEVRDIDTLTKLTKLRNLALNFTNVRDVGFLAEFANLEILGLRGTPVTDVRVLGELPNLRYVDLRETGIDNKQIADLKKALPNLIIKR